MRVTFGFVALLAACAPTKPSDVGKQCIPVWEYDQTFTSFEVDEVSVDHGASFGHQCSDVCLVNHFRGRVTCPYGQDKTATMLPGLDGASSGPFPTTDLATPPNPVGPCETPISSIVPNAILVTGDPVNDPDNGSQVHPQCIDRLAEQTVYCSCRCANADGRTDDGSSYCVCGDGFTCSQVSPTNGPAGAYCTKPGTDYDAKASCALPCDPTIEAQSCSTLTTPP